MAFAFGVALGVCEGWLDVVEFLKIIGVAIAAGTDDERAGGLLGLLVATIGSTAGFDDSRPGVVNGFVGSRPGVVNDRIGV